MLDRANTNDHRRKQLLACLRNLCFEYEDYEADFVQLDLLPKLVKLLVQEQGIAQLPSEWSHLQGVAPRELFMRQIDMDNTHEILDSIVLLINADKFLKELHQASFQTLLRCVKCPNFGETMTKVDLIAGQLASVDGPAAD